ncbi:tripartite tricarboxylate transporter substrate binding protein [Peribacillus cavernae]|uniref:Tripartite tricarboxylate transporter substrate binding protein n=1 Tax=Peribacillus cavernae TaxID=1674310 RepID=A0A433HFD1_9BACI|nr:tripartite tricarboxylate transporter substrate binding protein [Peribacillus cavernae]MDQ0219535.1 tripartite-type tricarboxylate transporter receptor subunit TctC [Peribacillus cavernae]RUQ27054.1 tripartite tricarboxylate transporter substrate binding protein [Peribacillus cavernae]
MKKRALAGLLSGVLSVGIALSGCSSANNSASGDQNKDPEYPTKQIEVIVPFAAGGGTDLTARAVTEYLSEEWDKPVVVVNKPGAGGATGTQAVLKQGSKDGHSVLIQSVSAVSALYAGNNNLPFSMEDQQFLTKLTGEPLAYVVSSDAPYKDINELIEWVKKNPDKLTYASNGPTAIGTFGTIQFMDSIGADFSKARQVATNGAGDALPKVAGGHIKLAVQGISEVSNLVKAGKLKILGIAAPERSPFFPDVPTMEEQGINDIDASQWYGASAPAGTPDYVVEKWETTVDKMLNDPKFIEKLKTINVTPAYEDAEGFAKSVKEETEKYKEIAKEKGLVK